MWNQTLAENVSVKRKGRVNKLSECRRSHWGRQLAQRDSEVISRRFIDLRLYYGPFEQSFSSELQILNSLSALSCSTEASESGFFIVTIIIICWLFSGQQQTSTAATSVTPAERQADGNGAIETNRQTDRQNSNSETLILKDSSVGPI